MSSHNFLYIIQDDVFARNGVFYILCGYVGVGVGCFLKMCDGFNILMGVSFGYVVFILLYRAILYLLSIFYFSRGISVCIFSWYGVLKTNCY